MVPAARWGDAVLVRAFRPRMICTACGIISADARPNWPEMQASGNVATTTFEIEARFGKALWKNRRARSSAIMHNPESHADAARANPAAAPSLLLPPVFLSR